MTTKSILLGLALIAVTLSSKSQNLVWAKQIGGSNYEYGNSIATDASGNVYTAGTFQGTLDFDPGPGTFTLTPIGGQSAFISKSDASGNFVWAKEMGGPGSSGAASVFVDALGNIYTAGHFGFVVDFDPGIGTYTLAAIGSSDIFISKLDASGNFVWAKQLGGTSGDYGKSITIDGLGNVYTSGYFQGTVDFDPGAGTFNLSSSGSFDDIFISKLDASGNFIWAKKLGGSGGDQGLSIATDVSGNVYTTGYFSLVVDFDPGSGTYTLSTAGNHDIFISKLDASGNFVWAKQLGGIGGDDGNSITTDASGNVYTTGFFSGTPDFDPGPGTFTYTSAGLQDIFISKLDASGNFVWAKQFGGTGGDRGLSIANDASGNVYTTGFFGFGGTVDFDPGIGTYTLAAIGSSDIFISKLDASGNFVWTAQIGGLGIKQATSINTDVSGNVYLTGNFNGNPDFDPGLAALTFTSAGVEDVFVVKLNQISTAITENVFNSQLNIFPNPTDGQLTINFSNITDATVIVRNTLGQQILNKTFTDSFEAELFIDANAGIYFLEIYANNKIARFKIIKE